jgi:hypothetical protein
MDIQKNLNQIMVHKENGTTYLPNQIPAGLEGELEPASEALKEQLLDSSKEIDNLVQECEGFKFSKFVRIEGGRFFLKAQFFFVSGHQTSQRNPL